MAICGAPLVGKREILNRLAESAGHADLEEKERWSGERILRLRVTREVLAQCRKATQSCWRPTVEGLELRLASGHLFFEETVIKTIIDEVSLICYVVESAETGPYQDSQNEYFRKYADLIRENLPTATPWVWVLNKVDFGMTNPLEHLIPEERRGDVVSTVAIKGRGIDVLWARILGYL
ncbi:MAG: hypothetical protein GY708_10900 [Actinomycetia bacterium]|nr:hypothetical protein [Actinomycetes bacterium]